MRSFRNGGLGLALAALLALLLSSVVAPGLMPARAADGSFSITICTDHGLIEVDPDELDRAAKTGQHGDPAAKGRPCPWAMAHAPATPAGTATTTDAVAIVTRRATPLPASKPQHETSDTAPFAARAPPLSGQTAQL